MSSGEVSVLNETAYYVLGFLTAAHALFFYEYIITFSQEIQFVWNGKLTGANVLFGLNRYLTLFYCILWFMPEEYSCMGYSTYKAAQAMNAIQCSLYALWAVFSAFRVYAIGGGIRMIPAMILALGFVPVATNIYNFTHQIFYVSPSGQCSSLSAISVPVQTKFIIATRVCMMVSDVLALIVTWRVTWAVRSENVDCAGFTLTTLLLRDGTVYFAVLLTLNLLQTILWATQVFLNVSIIAEIITSILISRFFLNLRAEHYASTGTATDRDSMSMSDLTFQSRILGNIGATLDHEAPWANAYSAQFSGSEMPTCSDDEWDDAELHAGDETFDARGQEYIISDV